MHTSRRRRRSLGLAILVVAVTSLLATVSLVGGLGGSVPSVPTSAPLRPASAPLTITNFGFKPSTVDQGSSTQGNVSLSGGTSNYYLWFNNTPAGCSPSSEPMIVSSPGLQFSCRPTATGTYTIHLDVLDSSAPVSKVSQTTNLNVIQSNNNGGNGSNGNGGGNNSGGLNLPSGLLQLGLYLILAFLAALVALAAGMIATAVVLSRRLRKLTEVLEQTRQPPRESKPPG